MKGKVMITGGAGFIGSRLVLRLLNDGYQVHVFDLMPLEKALRLKNIKNNSSLIYTQGDLRDKNKIKEWYQEDASHLFHLARKRRALTTAQDRREQSPTNAGSNLKTCRSLWLQRFASKLPFPQCTKHLAEADCPTFL